MTGRAPVLLVGGATDAHVAALEAALRAPLASRPSSWTPGASPRTIYTCPWARFFLDVRLAGVALGRPAAVFLRGLHSPPIAFDVDVADEMEEDSRTTLVAFREKAEFLVALLLRWEEAGVPIYNPLGASDRLRKPFQLARLAEAGFPGRPPSGATIPKR